MFDTNGVKAKMTAVVDRFKEEMKKVRTGRAHPDMLANVKAEVYGQYMPLNQIANITVQGATMLLITPYDMSNIEKISSAIRADQALGLNPADDGRVIRVPIPPLTEERRKEIVKTASGKVEESKVQLRQAREDARKDIKGMELAEDAKKRAEKAVDDMIHEFNTEIDKLFAEKEAEIMRI
ncbi:ribosome recycling factor [Candidatus Saccharibacteria bacterium]|nr:ribosome recycling factor [Candidatus Saccharibacteria bacterium]